MTSPNPTSYTLQVTDQEAGQRLDAFITQQLPTYSRSFYQKLCDQGLVTVNEKVVTRPGITVKAGDTVAVTMPTITLPQPKPIPADLGVELLFEHPDFLIINKPAGLVVHAPSTESNEITLVDWLLHRWRELKDIGELDRPGIVHRLDKDTSGVMVIARNSPAHAKLSAMFKNREIKKTYLALVQGHPDKSGTIDFAIDRDPVHRYMMTHGSGREAVTHYQVLQYFELATLIEAKPVTGRTHQIRVHFAAIGHPILGDETYGTSSPCISRQALHASSLSFTFNNTPFTFTAELPADFQRALSCLNQIDS